MRVIKYNILIYFVLFLDSCFALKCRSDAGPKEEELRSIYKSCLKKQDSKSSHNRNNGDDMYDGGYAKAKKERDDEMNGREDGMFSRDSIISNRYDRRYDDNNDSYFRNNGDGYGYAGSDRNDRNDRGNKYNSNNRNRDDRYDDRNDGNRDDRYSSNNRNVGYNDDRYNDGAYNDGAYNDDRYSSNNRNGGYNDGGYNDDRYSSNNKNGGYNDDRYSSNNRHGGYNDDKYSNNNRNDGYGDDRYSHNNRNNNDDNMNNRDRDDRDDGNSNYRNGRDDRMSGSNNMGQNHMSTAGKSIWNRRDLNDEFGSFSEQDQAHYNAYRSTTQIPRRYKREKQTNSGQRSQYNPNHNSKRKTGYDASYRNNDKNSNENNSSKDMDKKACALHCFLENMEMTGDDGMPDRYLVTHAITKDIKDEDLKDFLQESIEECFQILDNENSEDKCAFSKNLLVCLSEKGRANCDDWKDDFKF